MRHLDCVTRALTLLGSFALFCAFFFAVSERKEGSVLALLCSFVLFLCSIVLFCALLRSLFVVVSERKEGSKRGEKWKE